MSALIAPRHAASVWSAISQSAVVLDEVFDRRHLAADPFDPVEQLRLFPRLCLSIRGDGGVAGGWRPLPPVAEFSVAHGIPLVAGPGPAGGWGPANHRMDSNTIGAQGSHASPPLALA